MQKRKRSIHLAVVRARKNKKKWSVVIIHRMRKRLVAVSTFINTRKNLVVILTKGIKVLVDVGIMPKAI